MPERGTLSITKAQKIIGYNPQNPVEKGFINYINWYKYFYESNPKLFKKKI
jgi:nucleoside-diphosphate-sugar epimerase